MTFFWIFEISWLYNTPPKKRRLPSSTRPPAASRCRHVPSAQQHYGVPAKERASVLHLGEGGAWKSHSRGRLACPPPAFSSLPLPSPPPPNLPPLPPLPLPSHLVPPLTCGPTSGETFLTLSPHAWSTLATATKKNSIISLAAEPDSAPGSSNSNLSLNRVPSPMLSSPPAHRDLPDFASVWWLACVSAIKSSQSCFDRVSASGGHAPHTSCGNGASGGMGERGSKN